MYPKETTKRAELFFLTQGVEFKILKIIYLIGCGRSRNKLFDFDWLKFIDFDWSVE